MHTTEHGHKAPHPKDYLKDGNKHVHRQDGSHGKSLGLSEQKENPNLDRDGDYDDCTEHGTEVRIGGKGKPNG